MRKSKFKLAVDLDDTLIDTRTPMWKLHCESSGINLDSPERAKFDYHQIWQTDPDYCNRLMRMYMSGQYVGQPKILTGAKKVLLELSETHRLIVVTARNIKWYLQTLLQLRALDCDFHQVHLCTDESGETTPKALLCREYGYDMIIDDHPETTIECSAIGMKAFLFGQYPWTTNHHGLPDSVRHVCDWHHVRNNIMPMPRA